MRAKKVYNIIKFLIFFHIRFVDIYQLLVYHLESHQQDAMSTGQRFNYSPPLSLHAIYYAQENSVAREKEDKERKVSTKVRKRKKEDEKKNT